MHSEEATTALCHLLEGPRVRRRAQRLLDRVGALSGLITANERWLIQAGGLTDMEAKRIRAAFALSHFALVATLPSPLTRPEGVVRYMASLLMCDVEEGWVLTVGSGLRPLGRHRVARGGPATCALGTDEVLRAALLDGARGLFLIHNHPSGDPEPSEPDRRFTVQLLQAAKTLNLLLHDHIVVARGRWASCLTGARGGSHLWEATATTPLTAEPVEAP